MVVECEEGEVCSSPMIRCHSFRESVPFTYGLHQCFSVFFSLFEWDRMARVGSGVFLSPSPARRLKGAGAVYSLPPGHLGSD